MDNNENNKKVPVQPFSYDDKFIEHYVSNPKAGRCNALRKAGYKGDYVTQEASRIFKRCQDKIKAVFTDRIANLDGAAYEQLQNILNDDVKTVGYNNMLSAIEKGMQYSGRKLADNLVITKQDTIEDLDKQTSDLIKQIAQEENKTIAQVMNELESPASNTIN